MSHDKILRLFLRPEMGQVSPHLGEVSILNDTENFENNKRKTLEKIQETAPRNCRDFCPDTIK